MPDEIIEIGRNAFYKCTDLESFFFPKSLRKIGEEAFYQAGLQEIELPDDLEEIGPSAFFEMQETGICENSPESKNNREMGISWLRQAESSGDCS